MNNNLNNFPFPYFPLPSPPPPHPFSPPPPPPHPTSPPPKPHPRPPPPPPHPHPHPPPYVPPPPPSLPPPSPPHNYIIIIFIFSTFGCILLGLAILAFCCFLKKKKKNTIIVEEKQVKHIDDHLKVKEAIVEGPHGKLETVVLSVEEDLHEVDDIVRTKKELEEVHRHNLLHANNKSSEITPSALEAGYGHSSTSSSST